MVHQPYTFRGDGSQTHDGGPAEGGGVIQNPLIPQIWISVTQNPLISMILVFRPKGSGVNSLGCA